MLGFPDPTTRSSSRERVDNFEVEATGGSSSSESSESDDDPLEESLASTLTRLVAGGSLVSPVSLNLAPIAPPLPLPRSDPLPPLSRPLPLPRPPLNAGSKPAAIRSAR